MTFDDILEKIKEHYVICIIVVIFIVSMIFTLGNRCSKSGLKKYSYYEVGVSLKEIVNTGVGNDFRFRLKINGRYLDYEEPYIESVEYLNCDFELIEDDDYDDTAYHSFSFNAYDTSSFTFIILIKEYGGYSNAGTYAKCSITITLTGCDDPYRTDYDYDYDDVYNWEVKKRYKNLLKVR